MPEKFTPNLEKEPSVDPESMQIHAMHAELIRLEEQMEKKGKDFDLTEALREFPEAEKALSLLSMLN